MRLCRFALSVVVALTCAAPAHADVITHTFSGTLTNVWGLWGDSVAVGTPFEGSMVLTSTEVDTGPDVRVTLWVGAYTIESHVFMSILNAPFIDINFMSISTFFNPGPPLAGGDSTSVELLTTCTSAPCGSIWTNGFQTLPDGRIGVVALIGTIERVGVAEPASFLLLTIGIAAICRRVGGRSCVSSA